MTCSALSGGRRRRSRKTRRGTRKMRGGQGYGFGQPLSVNTLEVVPNITSTADGSIPGVGPVPSVGGRRRGSRRSRKTRGRRSMRGGGGSSNVGASFAGDGSRGLASYSAYSSNPSPTGAFAIPTGTR